MLRKAGRLHHHKLENLKNRFMSAKYRLLENLGVFVVQRLVIETTLKYKFRLKILSFIFKPKQINNEVYKTLGVAGYPVGFLNPKKKFKTKEKAIKWIETLEEKYHNVELNNKNN